MISFLEIVQKFPIGTKVTVMEGSERIEKEIIGYEYFNSKGYLLFRGSGKVETDRLTGMDGGSSYLEIDRPCK